MNYNTIIEFDFNEKTERDNQNFYFKYAWKKVWKIWIKITACAIVFLFIASLPIENFDTSIFYYLFKYGGICLSIFSFILVNHYFSSKKKFKIEVDKQIKKFKNTTESHFVTMDDKTIEFKNQFTTVKSVWENTVYALTGDYILICPINNLYYIIHKSEVSNHEFEVVKDYLNKNSKQQNKLLR